MKKLFILAFMAIMATLFTTTLSSCHNDRHTRSNEKCVIENADSVVIADIAVGAVVNPVFTNQDDVVRFVQNRKDIVEFDNLIHSLSYECIRTIASVISNKYERFTINAFIDEYNANRHIYDAMTVNDPPATKKVVVTDTIPITKYRPLERIITTERRTE